MVFEELYPNRFIQAADLKGRDITLTIEAVRGEEMVGMKGKEWKAVITFVGKKKELVANRTNGEAIKLMFSREIDKWIGKRVTIYPTEVEVAGSMEPCIRVRGSPDIDKPMRAEVKRGKKTLKISVVPTGRQGGPVVNGGGNGKPAAAAQTSAPTAAASTAAAPAKPAAPPEYAEAGPDTVPEPPEDLDHPAGEDVPF